MYLWDFIWKLHTVLAIPTQKKEELKLQKQKRKFQSMNRGMRKLDFIDSAEKAWLVHFTKMKAEMWREIVTDFFTLQRHGVGRWCRMVPEEKGISREVEELYKLQGRQTQEKK